MSYDDGVTPPPPPAEPPPPAGPPQFPLPSFYPPYYAAPPRRPTNTLAVVSLAFSLVGIMTCFVILCPVGVILGYIARRQISTRAESGNEIAIVGITVGWVGTAVVVIGGAILLIPLVVWLVTSF